MDSTINIFQHSKDSIEFKKGDVIFNQGDPGDVMYVIQEGIVDVFRDGVKIDEVHPGRVFGEMALIRKAPRSGTIIAQTDLRVVPVNARKFLFLIDNNRQFALGIMRALCERIIETDGKLAAHYEEKSSEYRADAK